MPDNKPRRISTPTLVIGVPGAGKTSLLATSATYVWDTFRKITLLYSWDGGAIPTHLQKLMRYGIIRFWRCRTRSGQGLGIEGTMLATKGYWPAEIDPETGETDPAVRLVPPLTGMYTVTCPTTGEVLATLPAMETVSPILCAHCKVFHTKGDLVVTGDIKRTTGFEEVGAVCFDSLTAIGYVVLDHLDQARGAGQIGGEKSAHGGVVTSGDLKFGGINRADIGFAQTRCREAVQNSQTIPGLVASPVFTALSFEATDEGGLAIVGPKLPGRAATDEASAWFGNVYEMGRTTDEKGAEHFTLFLSPFTDSQGRRHLLKNSASPFGLPERLVDPVGQPWADANLGLVMRRLDDDLAKMEAEDIPGAPGIAKTPRRYGETFKQLPPAPAPAATTGGNGGGQLPPLVLPTATPAAAATAAMVAGVVATVAPAITPSGSPPPAVAARRRPRVEPPAPAAPEPPPTTPPMPPPEDPPAAAAPLAPPAGGPPPPPGMKPPQRAPGA